MTVTPLFWGAYSIKVSGSKRLSAADNKNIRETLELAFYGASQKNSKVIDEVKFSR